MLGMRGWMKNIGRYNMYGFQQHLSSQFPSQVIVDVTQVCNSNCIHCPHSEFEETYIYKGLHLLKQLNKKLVDEVTKHNECQYIRYTANGEPLMHPDIIEMIVYAKQSGKKVNLTTNGKLLTKDISAKLIEAGVDVIDISINAFSEGVYKTITGQSLIPVKENVIDLIKQKGSTKVFVSFVKHPENKQEIDIFENYWNRAGVDKVLLREFHSFVGLIENNAEKKNRKPCLYPFERLSLSPNGFIHYCPEDWYGKSRLGDFRKVSLKEVWEGKQLQEIRQAHLQGMPNGLCKKCNDWQFTKFPNEGKSYANLMQDI